MPNIRIVVASKYPIVRTALATLLKTILGFEVVAETDLSQLSKVAKKMPRAVFVIELSDVGPGDMPSSTTLRAVATLIDAARSAAVVILSPTHNPRYIRTLRAAGVKTFLLRSASNSELYDAIRLADRHKRSLDPRVNSIELVLPSNTSEKRQLKPLSGREAQVLRLIALGFTTGAIASRLSISARTVQTYRERIYEKLQCQTRVDLVHYAIAHGILRDAVQNAF